MKDFIHPKVQEKLDALASLDKRYDRVKHLISGLHKDIIEGLNIELAENPKGTEMTEKSKIIRIYERQLGISAKGNPSKKGK